MHGLWIDHLFSLRYRQAGLSFILEICLSKYKRKNMSRKLKSQV